jgi:hypothetical protein
MQYLNHCIESLQDEIASSPTKKIQINPRIENALFDIGCKLTISKDFEAIACGNEAHPTMRQFHKAVRITMLYIQFRRLPKLFVHAVEALPTFIAHKLFKNLTILHQPDIRARFASTDCGFKHFGKSPLQSAMIENSLT